MTPTLTDFITGDAIRPATREERQRSKDAVISEPGGAGTFILDGRIVFVAGDFPTPAPTAHTPEPWRVEFTYLGYTDTCGGVFSTALVVGPGLDEAEANAARIVACVNACAGIADPGAALDGVRFRIRDVLNHLLDNCDGRDPASNDYIAATELRAALSLLGAK